MENLRALGLLVPLVLFGSVLFCSLVGASAVIGPNARASLRWSTAWVVFVWSLLSSFNVLGMSFGFRMAVVLPFWGGLAALAGLALRRSTPLRELVLADWRGFCACFGTERRQDTSWWLLCLAVALAALRASRLLVSPALGWDALVYHLPKAAQWVQHGRPFIQRLNDIPGLYQYYAWGAEIVWSWALLPFHDESLLAWMSLAVWAGFVLAVYACSRELGASWRGAAFAAGASGVIPCVLNWMNAAYSDILPASLSVAALGLFAAMVRQKRPMVILPLAMSVGAAVSARHPQAPFAAIVMLLGVGYVVMRATRWETRTSLAIGAALVFVLPFIAERGLTWAATGSPTYPFAVHLGPLAFRGSSVLNFARANPVTFAEELQYIRVLALQGTSAYPGSAALGIHPLSFPMLIMAVVALIGMLVKRRWLIGFVAGASVALPLLGIYSSAFSVQRVALSLSSGRFWIPALGAAFVLASTLFTHRRIWDVFFVLFLVIGVALSWPNQWGPWEWNAVVRAAFPLLAVFGIFLSCLRFRSRAAFIGGALILCAGLSLIQTQIIWPARHALRPKYLKGMAELAGPVFEGHGLHAERLKIPKFLARLEAPGEKKVAWMCKAGLTYFFPLLGENLQNQVVYVSPRIDGYVADGFTDRAPGQVSGTIWLQRLYDQGITHALLCPTEQKLHEEAWIAEHPAAFTALESNKFYTTLVVNRAALARALARSGERSR